jgi:hypothetical protein
MWRGLDTTDSRQCVACEEITPAWYSKIQTTKLVATIVEEDVAFGPENLRGRTFRRNQKREWMKHLRESWYVAIIQKTCTLICYCLEDKSKGWQ